MVVRRFRTASAFRGTVLATLGIVDGEGVTTGIAKLKLAKFLIRGFNGACVTIRRSRIIEHPTSAIYTSRAP